MNRIITVFFAILLLQTVSARDYPVQFSKRIENNFVKCRLENVQPDGSIKPLSNLDGKTDIEILLSAKTQKGINIPPEAL